MAATRHIVFAFAGLGLEPLLAARDLFKSSKVYRDTIAELDFAIEEHYKSENKTQPFANLSEYLLEEGVRPARNPTFETATYAEGASPTQPPTSSLLIFAAQYALARVVRAEGVEPDSVVGYSLGDCITAAVTGSFPLDAAIKLILKQDEVFDDRELVPEEGAVLAIFESLAETLDTLKQVGLLETVDIAGFPRPNATIVGGSFDAINRVQTEFEALGMKTRKTDLNLGMHSYHVQPIADVIANDPNMSSVTESNQAKVKRGIHHWSTPLGKELPPGTSLDSNYWATNLKEPVRFEQCIQGIQEQNSTRELVFLNMDMRPRPAPMIEQNLQGSVQWQSGQARTIGILELPPDVDVSRGLEDGWTWKALKQNLSRL